MLKCYSKKKAITKNSHKVDFLFCVRSGKVGHKHAPTWAQSKTNTSFRSRSATLLCTGLNIHSFGRGGCCHAPPPISKQ